MCSLPSTGSSATNACLISQPGLQTDCPKTNLGIQQCMSHQPNGGNSTKPAGVRLIVLSRSCQQFTSISPLTLCHSVSRDTVVRGGLSNAVVGGGCRRSCSTTGTCPCFQIRFSTMRLFSCSSADALQLSAWQLLKAAVLPNRLCRLDRMTQLKPEWQTCFVSGTLFFCNTSWNMQA